jgi:hypothetical protein
MREDVVLVIERDQADVRMDGVVRVVARDRARGHSPEHEHTSEQRKERHEPAQDGPPRLTVTARRRRVEAEYSYLYLLCLALNSAIQASPRRPSQRGVRTM